MLKTYSDTPLVWDTEKCAWVNVGRKWDGEKYVERPTAKVTVVVSWPTERSHYKIKTHLEWLYEFWMALKTKPDWVEDLKEAEWEAEDIQFMVELDRMEKAGIK